MTPTLSTVLGDFGVDEPFLQRYLDLAGAQARIDPHDIAQRDSASNEWAQFLDAASEEFTRTWAHSDDFLSRLADDLEAARSAHLADAERLNAADERTELRASESRAWEAHLDHIDQITPVLKRTQETLMSTRTNLGPTGELSTAHRTNDPDETAFRSWMRTGDEHEIRASGIGTGAKGGYTVPTGFRTRLVEALQAFGGIRRMAEVISTNDGTDLPWASNDDTLNAGHILGENTQDDERDVEFGQGTLGAYPYTSRIVRVSLQLIQDSAFNLDTMIPRKMGQRIGRAQAPHFLTGTGTNQPQGAITGSTVGVTAAGATAIAYDELVDIVTSVDSAYLVDADPGANDVGWVMNQITYGLLRKLKDADGRPLIEPDVQRSGPMQLLGYPIQIDNGMANPTAGESPILFGNIRAGYVIRDVGIPEVFRLVERYADSLQVGFIGWQRSDGMVQDASAMKRLKMADS